MLRIQGFPDSYKIVLPYSKVKHQCGNSVAVPVIKAVAEQMIKALKNYQKTIAIDPQHISETTQYAFGEQLSLQL